MEFDGREFGLANDWLVLRLSGLLLQYYFRLIHAVEAHLLEKFSSKNCPSYKPQVGKFPCEVNSVTAMLRGTVGETGAIYFQWYSGWVVALSSRRFSSLSIYFWDP